VEHVSLEADARPVHSMAPRNATSTAAEKGGEGGGVNTGAIFSITLCLASTSQGGDYEGPDRAARQQPRLEKGSTSTPMDWKISSMNPVSTAPPRAISV
jgi:hypothetical protein